MNWTATVWALALNMRVALFWAAWNTSIQAMANTTVLMSNVIRLPQSSVIASKHRSTAKKAGPETARLFLCGCRSAQNVAHLHWLCPLADSYSERQDEYHPNSEKR